MKVVIDTNIILDILLKRSPFDESSYKVLKLIEDGFIDGYIACYIVTDVYYFIEKELGKDIAKKAVEALLNVVKVVGITKADIEKALVNSIVDDFEDALQLRCVEKIKADYIVTRDNKLKRHFSKSISPENLLKILEKQANK